jgi:hypothetical protein
MELKVKGPSLSTGADFRIVKNNGSVDATASLVFTFSNFKMKPIKIDGLFNNFFGSQEEYIHKITVLVEKALPLLSNENYNLFNDASKMKTMHIHQLHGKEDILRQIFKEYQFSDCAINSFIEGAELYQLEVPFENGATRIVFERIDNLISFLFLDPNHHIYMNWKFVNQNNSLFYEYCPINESGECKRMDYFHTCFAFEYLDRDAYERSFSNGYDPNENL